MNEDNIIICRCEDVTLKDIRNLIQQGFTTIQEIKRFSRIGMGPCQGKTCGLLISKEIAEITGISIEKIELQNIRPP